jgi:hypothetical protein
MEIMPSQFTDDDDHYFVYSTLSFKVDSGSSKNAFSAYAAHSFSELTLYMTLVNKDTGLNVEIESTNLIIGDNNSPKGYHTYDMLESIAKQ